MFKKVTSILLCIILVLSMGLVLCSCNESEDVEYPVTIGDVTIEKEPMNIVVLSDCMADIISYIGYDVKMVGRSIECDQEFLSVVPLVGTATEPNVDSIISYQADLVIIEEPLSETAKSELDNAKIPVISFEKASSFEQLEALYLNLGTALGGNVTGKAEGQNAYNELLTTISDFESAVSGDILKTACYLYLDENGELCTLTKGTIEYELFSYCGAVNVFSTQETPQVDPEQLRISTPSYIIYDDEAVLEYLNNDSVLCTMGALTKGHTYQLKKSDFDRQGVTYEETIYRLIEYMFVTSVATPDEATPDTITAEQEAVVGFVE